MGLRFEYIYMCVFGCLFVCLKLQLAKSHNKHSKVKCNSSQTLTQSLNLSPKCLGLFCLQSLWLEPTKWQRLSSQEEKCSYLHKTKQTNERANIQPNRQTSKQTKQTTKHLDKQIHTDADTPVLLKLNNRSDAHTEI